jgi:hypothetical protein
MWPESYEQRLIHWINLRQAVQNAPLDQCLKQIDHWWQQVPWRPYYLHWDDRLSWPDPWQLISDNTYCDLARALGILYTIALIDRPDCQDSVLIECDQRNLVLISSGKYILNCSDESKVNTNLELVKKNRIVQQSELKLKYN